MKSAKAMRLMNNGGKPHGMFLYKYMEWGDGAKAILKDGTIKFTSPKDFNDPFDCRPYFDIPVGDYRYDAFNCQNVLFDQPPLNKIGICCLAGNPTSITMWSHYAACHRGVVVQFIVPDLYPPRSQFEQSEYLSASSVFYQNDRPAFNFDETDTSKMSVQAMMLIFGKSDAWEYEQEWRVVDLERGHGIHKFRRDEILSAVICGVQMAAEDMQEVREIVATINDKYGLNVKVFEAREVIGKFEITLPGHPIYDRYAPPPESPPKIHVPWISKFPLSE